MTTLQNLIIDFDNPKTFPEELKSWGKDLEAYICDRVVPVQNGEWWRIKWQLQDLPIEEKPIVTEYLSGHMDAEVAVGKQLQTAKVTFHRLRAVYFFGS